MKLVLRDSCYTGINSTTKVLQTTENHKQLVNDANNKIKQGKLRYAKAYTDSKDYYK